MIKMGGSDAPGTIYNNQSPAIRISDPRDRLLGFTHTERAGGIFTYFFYFQLFFKEFSSLDLLSLLKIVFLIEPYDCSFINK